jgi:hypothetical protein
MLESDDEDDDLDDTDRSSTCSVVVSSSCSESLRGSLVRDFSLFDLLDDDRLFSVVSIVAPATVSVPRSVSDPWSEVWLRAPTEDWLVSEELEEEEEELLDDELLEEEELELLLEDDALRAEPALCTDPLSVVSVGSIDTDSTSRLPKRAWGGGRFSISVSSVLSVSSSVFSDCVEVLLDDDALLLLFPLETLGLIDDEEDEDEDDRDESSSSSDV